LCASQWESSFKIPAPEGRDWAQLALDLGYFDQTHLINDFKSIVGYSPTEYRKLISTVSNR
jgi:AraC-like DNA-binding protein